MTRLSIFDFHKRQTATRNSTLGLCVIVACCVGCNEQNNQESTKQEVSQKKPLWQTIHFDESHRPRVLSNDVSKALLAGKVSETRIRKAEYFRQPRGPFFSISVWNPGYPRAVVAVGDAHLLLTTVSQSSKRLPYDPNCPKFDSANIRHVGNLLISLDNGAIGCLKIFDVLNSNYYHFCPGRSSFPSNWGPHVRFVAKSKVPLAIWNQKAHVDPKVPLLFPDLSDKEVDALGEKKFGEMYKLGRQYVVDSATIKRLLGDLQRIHSSVGPNHRMTTSLEVTGRFTFWLQGTNAEGIVSIRVPDPNVHPKARITGRLLITKSDRDVPDMTVITLDREE